LVGEISVASLDCPADFDLASVGRRLNSAPLAPWPLLLTMFACMGRSRGLRLCTLLVRCGYIAVLIL
jgi:hypothetical protein